MQHARLSHLTPHFQPISLLLTGPKSETPKIPTRADDGYGQTAKQAANHRRIGERERGESALKVFQTFMMEGGTSETHSLLLGNWIFAASRNIQNRTPFSMCTVVHSTPCILPNAFLNGSGGKLFWQTEAQNHLFLCMHTGLPPGPPAGGRELRLRVAGVQRGGAIALFIPGRQVRGEDAVKYIKNINKVCTGGEGGRRRTWGRPPLFPEVFLDRKGLILISFFSFSFSSPPFLKCTPASKTSSRYMKSLVSLSALGKDDRRKKRRRRRK